MVSALPTLAIPVPNPTNWQKFVTAISPIANQFRPSSFGFFCSLLSRQIDKKKLQAHCRPIATTFWDFFGIFVHCEMQQSWAKKTLKNFHRIYSIHFYIQQQLSVIFFYHDNLTKSIYYSLAHFRSAHVIIPNKVHLKVLWRALFTKYNLIFVLVMTVWTI